MTSHYQPGDSVDATRDFVRVHRPDCILRDGDCGDPYDLVPQPWRYYIKRPDLTQVNISEADYIASQQHYRRTRDATLDSPEAIQNIARWAASLTDVQLESTFAEIYGAVTDFRAFFNALRTRVRAARGN